jgi:hypothetical protein
VGNPASIMIFVPDDCELGDYLDVFKAMGFRETDWCELTKVGSDAVICYGPCEPRRKIRDTSEDADYYGEADYRYI